MPHEIHVSERKAFRGCTLRWDFSYRQGYQPEISPSALAFGIAFHKGLEAFYQPDTWSETSLETKRNESITALCASLNSQLEGYLAAYNLRTPDEEALQRYREQIDLGTGMLRYYAEVVHPTQDDWFVPVRVEQEFSVPLYNPYTHRPDTHPLLCWSSPACGQDHSNPAPVELTGRIDALLKSRKTGGLYILDHKTTAQLLTNTSYLELDDQISGYTAALKRRLGLDIRGFIYAECRKAFPSPPRVLKTRRAGGILSQDCKQLTSADLYRREIEDQGEDPSTYTSFLAYLDSPEAPQFHVRHTLTKSDQELDNVLRIAAMEAKEMINPGIPIYPEPGRYTCNTCAFQQPCAGKLRGEDYQYTLDTLYTRRQPYGADPLHT